MITAIVNFRLPAEIDAKKAAELFKGSASKYRGMTGLVRKYYLFDEQNRVGGGVYLWKSRADADAVYTPQWKAYTARHRRSATSRRRWWSTTRATKFSPTPPSVGSWKRQPERDESVEWGVRDERRLIGAQRLLPGGADCVVTIETDG
jgi:hypothetical protein